MSLPQSAAVQACQGARRWPVVAAATGQQQRSDAVLVDSMMQRRPETVPETGDVPTQRRSDAHPQSDAPTKAPHRDRQPSWPHISGGWVRMVASGRPTCCDVSSSPHTHSNVTRPQRRWSTPVLTRCCAATHGCFDAVTPQVRPSEAATHHGTDTATRRR
jgi:hypothetical protein